MGLARQIRRLRKNMKEVPVARKRRKALLEPLEPRMLLSADIAPEKGQAILDGLEALRDFGQELEGFGDLGLWSKPGAGFLCLEPWCGTASPLGWDGEFMEKPGIARLSPGESRTFRWRARPIPA